MAALPGLQPTAMSETAKLAVLKKCTWFTHHGINDLLLFSRYLHLYQVPAQHTLFEEGDQLAFMCILVKGEVTLIKQSQRGDFRSLAQLEQGQLFGEMALIDGASRTATATTATDCDILILESCDFQQIRKRHPLLGSQLLYAFITTLTSRLRLSDGRLVDLTADYGELEQRSRQALLDKNAELEAALSEARRSNQLKDQFLATISHELRTPMNGIEGALQLIDPDHLPEPDRTHLSVATQSAATMTDMVELLLEHTELLAGKTSLIEETISLPDFFSHLLGHVQQRCDAKALQLVVELAADLPSHVTTDVNRLALIVNQILQNAVKFTNVGEVQVSVHWRPDDAARGLLEISIKDTGIGMDVSLLPELLQGFRQADSRFSRRYEGLGIGLATCRKILDVMQGDMDIHSTPHQGTHVNVRIPMCRSDATAKQPASTNEPVLSRLILIVEDNPVNQLIITKMVKAMGFATLTANDGLQALEALENSTPDLILMDCQMPHLDGYEATQRIRNRTDNKATIPIIAVTANAMARDRERCLAVGMNDYLKKPISKQTLEDKIRAWVA